MLTSKAYSLAQKIMELRHPFRENSCIYMFHEVYASGEIVKEDGLAVSQKRFERWLDSIGKQVRSISCFGERGSVVLTFDDVFVSIVRNAVPFLLDHRLPFTLFISPGLLNKSVYLETQQLRELAQEPLCTIGAHSMSHALMRPMPAVQAHRELMDSRLFLEDLLGKRIVYFAFPYGSVYSCSRENINLVQKCGFQAGFSTINRAVCQKDLENPWFLPRINRNDTILRREGYN